MSKRILDLNTISSASNDDYLVVDGSSGTRKITPENVVGNSTVVQTLTNDISNVSDDIEEMQSTIGSLQGAVENIPIVDAVPTEGSTNAVQSGGVYDAIKVTGVNLKKFNAVNLLPQKQEQTLRGVTLSPNIDGTYNLSGTATASTSFQLYNVADALPDGIVPGNKYNVRFSAKSGTKLRFYKYIDGTIVSQSFCDLTADGEVEIPSDAEGLSVAFYVPNGTAFSNDVMYAFILNALTNTDLTEKLNDWEVLYPDQYSGGDTNRIQNCINKLSTTGGIIVINRKYTLNSSVVCNLLTDNSDPVKNHIYITFIGIGENAGFEFASAAVSFQGNDAGSPYGGLRFKNINFTRPSAGVGYGSAFTKMAGMIRTVFDNCRFNGFAKVFDCTDNGTAMLKLVQNLTCINCYFTNISDYVLDVYSIGDLRRAAYIYAVSIVSCTVENCKGLIKGSSVSGYSVWTNLNIENCTIESCTGIPIVFGVGARSVKIHGNYFEKNDYENTHICIDMSNLFGSNHSSPANVFGVNIFDNVFIKGIDTESYTAQSVAIKFPAFEPWTENDSTHLLHGAIYGNVVEDVFVSYDEESPFGNKRRWNIYDNAYSVEYDADVFYDYSGEKIKSVIPYASADIPSVDGEYVLKANVSNGNVTFEWEQA